MLRFVKEDNRWRPAAFAALAGVNSDLARALSALHDLFSGAPLLGSLIEPTGGDLVDPVRVARIEEMLDPLIKRARTVEPERAEGAIAARGMADAVTILVRHYTILVTNVPFLGRGRQQLDLAEYLARVYPDAKADLATAMLSRMERLASEGGTLSAVTPQGWLYLSGYKILREEFLSNTTFNVIAALGSRVQHQGAWGMVWHRFEEAGGGYEGVVKLLMSEEPPDLLTSPTSWAVR
jgi:hypothetical protein